MSSLINHFIKKAQLETLVANCGEKGIEITTSVNDETNKYGQNVSSWIAQSKEERENKVPRVFISNGAVVYTDGKIQKAEKQTQSDDSPF